MKLAHLGHASVLRTEACFKIACLPPATPREFCHFSGGRSYRRLTGVLQACVHPTGVPQASHRRLIGVHPQAWRLAATLLIRVALIQISLMQTTLNIALSLICFF